MSTQAGAAAASALTATLLQQQPVSGTPSRAAHANGVPWYSSYQTPSGDQRLAVSRAMATGMHDSGAGAAASITGGAGVPGSIGTLPGLANIPHLPFHTTARQSWNHQQNNTNNHAHPYRHPHNNNRNQRGNGKTRGGGGRGGSKAPHLRRTQPQQQQQDKNGGDGEVTKAEAAPSEEGAPSPSAALHCSACNITFNNEPAMKTHLAAHIKCPDCSFTASPGHVSNHRKTVHGPASSKASAAPTQEDNASSMASSKASSLTAATQHDRVGAGAAGGGGENDDDDDEEDDEDEESAYLKKKAQSSASAASSKAASKYSVATPSLAMYERHPLTPTFKTEEDIKNWIAERRKHWPSAENVKRKEEERQEMIAKGQIVPGDARGGKKNQTRQQKQQQQHHGKKRPNDRPAEGAQETGIKKAKTEEGDAASSSLTSTSGLVAYASSTSDDDEEENEDDKAEKKETTLLPPLSSAAALDEGESDNEDMDPVRDAITSKDPSSMGKIRLPSDRPVNTRHCKYFARGKCTRGDKCTFIHDASMVKKAPVASNKKETFRTRKSLLEMLLSSEIKDEKNKLLEALRYIVENNFFDKAEPAGPLVQEVPPSS
ncbi:hypothetical protein BGZ73_002928 [Actinomortierella ambigua]|nr:hypothetical protein BGZ73_002928 [Actinomortierella ambigua]